MTCEILKWTFKINVISPTFGKQNIFFEFNAIMKWNF
jgi:hypothetical protein